MASTTKETDSPASPDEPLDAVDNPLYHQMESLNCKPWPRRRQTSQEHLPKPADVSQISLSTSPLQASPPHSSSSSNGFSSASTAELHATGPHILVNSSEQDLNFVGNKVPPQPMPRSSPNEDKPKPVPTPAARTSVQQQKPKQTKHLVKTRATEPEEEEITFAKAKEEFKRSMNFSGMIYSDFPNLASTLPYFHISDSYRFLSPAGLHLVVCVHGLCGTSNDLRLVKAFLELGLPGSNLEFIMSDRNSCDTQADFDTMADRLVLEIVQYIEMLGLEPTRISFVGHSLGNVIIRAALSKPLMKPYQERFHTFLSLAGPHLGTLYNSSGLVNMGVWLLSRMKGSDSIVQLSCRDAPDLRKTFMYRLSQTSCLHKFKNVLLCGSSQDRYVPFHSARIELCKAAVKDQSPQGVAYREMVHNILHPIIMNPNVTFVRYDVHHCFNSHSADSLLGRAAHVAVLDSGKFLEKFLMVVGLKYFR